ncbi:ATP-binding protein [Cohnella sp. JJ-181]|uniref:ATP-binding protein n=1 Tax=Cohnella rhizoplanae TaxID=2974897 RepID=UPI0022FF55DE|nr:ATP-binding protein [Cohnella sp. JJ-181]CAI6031931.1 Sensor histidine kinase RcsC [Cohnella sp. JJ-181]
MEIGTTFFTSITILITFTFLFNLIYKYVFQHTAGIVKQIAMVVGFIALGWLAMKFGIRYNGSAIFDLRNVPIIFATLVFRDPRPILAIGFGIALARFGVNGMSPSAFTAFCNISTLGIVGAILVSLYRKRPQWGYPAKAAVSLLAINAFQVAGILSYAAVDRFNYLTRVMPYTLPATIVLGTFFLFIIRDFFLDQQRAVRLKETNEVLQKRTEELLETKKMLEEKAELILQASRYKSEFMANMSHELKTPLNSVILLSQMIGENADAGRTQDNRRYAEIIQASGEQLLHMINDILDLSKVEAGKMDIVWDIISLYDTAELLYRQMKPIAEAKGIELRLEIDPAVPPTLMSDGQRLGQILRNLLMNAIKFTDKGYVALIVSSERDPNVNNAGHIVFTVKDTGVGIEKSKQEMIFEAFQQEDGSINRRFGGTGLGLSISLQLSTLLGGTLSLNSAKGEGSEFTLRLPLKAAYEDRLSALQTAAAIRAAGE